MVIKRKESVELTVEESNALQIVYNLLAEIERDSKDDDLVILAGNINYQLDNLMEYIEE